MSVQARILAVIQLEGAELDELLPYLADEHPEVRTTAVNTLTETTPDGFETALIDALFDDAEAVRRAAAAGLRELDEVIDVDEALRSRLVAAATAGDDVVREAVLAVLRALRVGTRETYAHATADRAVAVRIEAVRGLVSLNEALVLITAAQDPDREVRVALADGLGTIGDEVAVPALAGLAADPDPFVRAAALAAAAGVGARSPLDSLAVAALGDRAWEVRRGAAIGLGAAAPDVAIEPLVGATADPHLDVRKAAVRALARWAGLPTVEAALRRALADTDADVRGYARRALTAVG